jgi:hypothetical protein
MKIYNESGYDLSEVESLLEQFYPFAQKTLQFDRHPTIKLVSDPENSQNMLGKTAYYNPSIDEVVIFVDKRHPKDILRSISHELVHHRQNCQGKFAEMPRLGEGYAQENEFLREMEKEAYLEGNMCFRDWEDGYKQNLSENRGNEMKNLTEEQIRAIVREKLKAFLAENQNFFSEEKEVIKESKLLNPKTKEEPKEQKETKKDFLEGIYINKSQEVAKKFTKKFIKK